MCRHVSKMHACMHIASIVLGKHLPQLCYLCIAKCTMKKVGTRAACMQACLPASFHQPEGPKVRMSLVMHARMDKAQMSGVADV